MKMLLNHRFHSILKVKKTFENKNVCVQVQADRRKEVRVELTFIADNNDAIPDSPITLLINRSDINIKINNNEIKMNLLTDSNQ